MTIKEFRNSLRKSQDDFARVLGISRKTYINLEKDDAPNKVKNYQNYYNLLLSVFSSSFKCKVTLGKDLNLYIDTVKRFKNRYCFKYLKDFIDKDYRGKVCILFGLRRTGKTTMLFQLLEMLDVSKTAYIKVNQGNKMNDLLDDIDSLRKRGVKNILIDEITLIDGFIESCSVLSDIYSMLGLKIILSGTDSLGFAFADRNELYDRNVMIHTSYISFKEFSYLLGENDIDKYIEYGGTLKHENMSFDDPNYKNDEVSFKDDESTRKYIDTAICHNIQNSLKNYKYGTMFVHLKELYENNELTNVINRIIQDMSHSFLISVIDKSFKSSDLGSSKNLLTKSSDKNLRTSLDDIDEVEVINTLKQIIDVKEKEERKALVDEEVLFQVKQYLEMLDLIKTVEYCYDDGTFNEYTIFTQPGMRYSITKALVYSLFKDTIFVSKVKKERIIELILNDVKGRMLEDIVLLDTISRSKDNEVFKYKLISGGEIDMVISKNNNHVDLYEIKHSSKMAYENQTRYLNDEKIISLIEDQFGIVDSKIVLYKGEDTSLNNINYINVERFLKRD